MIPVVRVARLPAAPARPTPQGGNLANVAQRVNARVVPATMLQTPRRVRVERAFGSVRPPVRVTNARAARGFRGRGHVMFTAWGRVQARWTGGRPQVRTVGRRPTFPDRGEPPGPGRAASPASKTPGQGLGSTRPCRFREEETGHEPPIDASDGGPTGLARISRAGPADGPRRAGRQARGDHRVAPRRGRGLREGGRREEGPDDLHQRAARHRRARGAGGQGSARGGVPGPGRRGEVARVRLRVPDGRGQLRGLRRAPLPARRRRLHRLAAAHLRPPRARGRHEAPGPQGVLALRPGRAGGQGAARAHGRGAVRLSRARRHARRAVRRRGRRRGRRYGPGVRRGARGSRSSSV